MTTEPKVLNYPTDTQLLETYQSIEQASNAALVNGEVTGNPILTGQVPDTRYSVCAQGYILGSPASDFLETAINKLQQAEPSIRFVDPDFLHLTLQEVVYSPIGKRPVGQRGAIVDAARAKAYYKALRDGVPSNPNIELKLHRVFPTLDAPINDSNLRSASVVASFLTEGDDTLFKIREDIGNAVTDANLPFSARLGTIKVIFITLGRLTQPPYLSDRNIPLLNVIADINRLIPNGSKAIIRDIQLISTTPVSYPYPNGHVFLYPPIDFDRSTRSDQQMEFLRPRAWLLRIMSL